MVNITVCEHCGAHYFPARLRCRRCGGTLFSQQPITEARVAGVTQIFQISDQHPWAWLLELEATPGVKLIAAAAFAPAPDNLVSVLQQDDGAIVAMAPSNRMTADGGAQ